MIYPGIESRVWRYLFLIASLVVDWFKFSCQWFTQIYQVSLHHEIKCPYSHPSLNFNDCALFRLDSLSKWYIIFHLLCNCRLTLLSLWSTLLPPSKVYYNVVNFYFSRLAYLWVASRLGFRKEGTSVGTDWNLTMQHSMGTDFKEWYYSSYTAVTFMISQE